jgi:glycerol-3-phosphate O-acyltransferase
MIEPKVGSEEDIGNYIMLYYYRNPITQLFFNESVVLASMHSFDLTDQWKEGVNRAKLFERACFLADLLKHEEYLQQRIEVAKPEFFDQVLQFMINKRVLVAVGDKLVLRTSGESQILFIQSLIFPVIDTYYVSLVYVLTFIKNKGIDVSSLLKSVQWLAELLFK